MKTTIESIVDLVVRDIQSCSVPPPSANWSKYKPGQLIRYAGFLSGLVCQAGFSSGGCAVEIGTDRGLGTMAIAHGLSFFENRRLFSFDTRLTCLGRAMGLLSETDLQGIVTLVNAGSDRVASVLPEKDRRVFFAYIDGNHSFSSCLADLQNLEPVMAPRSIILCHDYMHQDFDPEVNGVRPAVQIFCVNGKWTRVSLGGGFVVLGKSA